MPDATIGPANAAPATVSALRRETELTILSVPSTASLSGSILYTRRMPDRDDLGGAWKVPPSKYLASRPAEFKVGAPTSVYVTMADGCRLAVDVILPNGDASKR